MLVASAPLARHCRTDSRLDAFSDALLALSIILTSASALRIEGFPLGPGEFCLIVWIGLRASQEILFETDPPSGPVRWLATFWFVFAAAQGVGLMQSMSIDATIDWSLVRHDIVALALMAILSILCLRLRNAPFRLRRTIRYAMRFGCVIMIVHCASACDLVAVPGIDPWYWDRFRGWTANPNQLSLFCAILVPIACFGLESARSRIDRFAAFGCASAAFTVGLLTKGNSLRLALAIGACCCVALGAKRLFFPRNPRERHAALPLALVAVAVPLLVLSLVPFAAKLKTETIVEHVARDSLEIVNEAALRVELWNGAFDAGLRSYSVGLGPGPHAPVPPAVAVRERRDPGTDDPSLGDVTRIGAVMEAHNTYAELFSQGGILIVLAYVGLLIYALRQSLLSGSFSLPALLCVIATFGIFHVIVRHPIVWFGLCLCLGSADSLAQSRRRTDLAWTRTRTRSECRRDRGS